MKQATKKLIERALKIQQSLEQNKPLYQELDEIVLKLANEGFTSDKFENVEVEIVDNFASKNTCFKVAGVKRFELKVKNRV
jgi:hypothetical protein